MRIAVVGTGYVGLVTGACLASVGHCVTCVDISPERVAAINGGEVPFYEPGLPELLCTVLVNGRLRATTNLVEAVVGSELTFIAVGTPLAGEAIDLSQVVAAAGQVGRALREISGFHVVAIKSTVVPGTTDGLVRCVLEETSKRRVGDFGLCMNPEFLREGLAVGDFMDPDRIVIGQWDKASGQVLADVYQVFDCPKLLITLRNAEFIKYASNALLATLISFSNEMATLCEATPGTDVEVLTDGLHLDRRLSPVVNGERVVPGILSYLRAGSGFGGSCLPKDVNALRALARQRGVKPHLLDAVAAINKERMERVVALVEQMVGSLPDRTIAVLGLAFKPGTDDLRDSPSLVIIDYLLGKGAVVRGYDPVALKAARSILDKRVVLCDTPESALHGADAAVIGTADPQFAHLNWARLIGVMQRPIIIDGRNVLRQAELPLGVIYVSIGRGVGEGDEDGPQPRGVETKDPGTSTAVLRGRRPASAL